MHAPAVTIESILSTAGQSALQIQFAGPDFVLTRIGSLILVFDAVTATRSIADVRESVLRPLPTADLQRTAAEQRARMGAVTVVGPEREPHSHFGVIDRYRYFNHAPLVVVRGSVSVHRDPRLDGTALGAERAGRALEMPFDLPLEANQIVVESRTRCVSPELEQSSSFRLVRIQTGILEDGWVERIRNLPMVQATAA